jgi:uncharacterized membrane protein YkvA (DUF1232 family)
MNDSLSATTVEPLNHATFWRKMSQVVSVAGRGVLERALCLYYAAEAKSTPLWAKGVIYTALAYFILPADAIPDILPGLGYSDDFLTLTAAAMTVAMSITPAVKQQAREKVDHWLG